MDNKTFQYRGCLRGHTQDVKAVNNFSTKADKDLLVSCSRDRTSKVWQQDGFGQYKEAAAFIGHKGFVNCVAAMFPAGDKYTEGLIFSGGNDKSINIYVPGQQDPIGSLKSHTENVCCLTIGENGIVLSGSWDKTAKMWRVNLENQSHPPTSNLIYTMTGHKASVWDVLYRSSDEIVVTASADATIKIFKHGTLQSTITGHTDCVRGLSWIGQSGNFLSCSNDACIRQWSLDGTCLYQYYGHRNFVYSITVLPSGNEFVTSSEDRCIRVWTVGKEFADQTITLPSTSLWSVSALKDGDIAVGCSDGTLRLFTRDEDRVAEDSLLKFFKDEISSVEIDEKASDLGEIDVDKLKTRASLSADGTKDGQTVMVKHDGKVEAYQWSTAESQWVKIGDVVGANKTAEGKTTYNGKEYDLVFSVDVEEGKPPLKLPYNLDEEPYESAQRFIDTENLPQDYLEQITNFIITNSKDKRGPAPAQESMSCDDSSYRDPFTGSGGYVPGDASETNVNRSTSNKPTYFPLAEYLKFEQAKVSAMIQKIKQVTEGFASEHHDTFEKLTDANHVPTEVEIERLWSLLRWRQETPFVVFDLVRVFIARNSNATVGLFLASERSEELMQIFVRALSNPDPSKMANNSKMLVLKCLCNLFGSEAGGKFVTDHCVTILPFLGHPPADARLHVPLATLLMNFAVRFNTNKTDPRFEQGRTESVPCVLEGLKADNLPAEAGFRLLVALGTLLKDNQLSIACAVSLGASDTVDKLTNVHGGLDKIVGSAAQVRQLFRVSQ